ncbi:MAG TPA: nuclease [Bacteroidales bacterium]|nr:nuclease [Bacteroidales bacterium]
MKESFVLIIYLLIITSLNGQDSDITVGSNVSGKVISILDGDTYDLLVDGNRTILIRMEGIDAPDRGMPFFNVAKQHLAELYFNKHVTIKVNDIDNYGRFISNTYLNDKKDLSQEMIKVGLAWHFKKYNSDPVLSRLEIEARNLKKGLWIDKKPIPPWTNRGLHWQGISTKDSFNIMDNQK